MNTDIANDAEPWGEVHYSQKNFVRQITTAFPHMERGKGHIAKRRILSGIKLGEILG